MNTTFETEPVGVIGFGNLGSKLTERIVANGREAVVFDPEIDSHADRVLEVFKVIEDGDKSRDIGAISIADSRIEVLREVRFVHVAAPLEALNELPKLSPDNLGVLHDSTMTSSIRARQARVDGHKFAVVHCLMNETNTAAIAEGMGPHKAVAAHMAKLGHTVRRIDPELHDMSIGAEGQALLSLLVRAGILDSLTELHEHNLLTPSAQELLRVIEHRNNRWTEATLDSLAMNPFLRSVLQRLMDLLPEDRIERDQE